MKKILLLFIILGFISCENGEIPQLKNQISALISENKELKNQIETLQADIEQYKNTPDKLIANADLLFKNKNKSELNIISSKLQKYHPTSKEAEKVHNMIAILEKEELKKIEEEKQKRLGAVKKLHKKYDDVSDITWYENPYFTHYNNTNHTSIYIGKSSSSVWLRLKMSYNGDDWIFFEKAYLSYDGNTQHIPFDKYRDKKSDNDTEVWEWIDVSVDDDMLSFIRNMANGKVAKMRLSGKYTHTKTLSQTEIKAIKDILLAYDVLKSGQ